RLNERTTALQQSNGGQDQRETQRFHGRKDHPVGRRDIRLTSSSPALSGRAISSAKARPDSSLSSGTAVSDAGRLDQQRIDPLEATRQLVATPATLALVMLEVFRTQRQGPLAGLQHQGGAFRQHRQIDQVFLAAGDPLAGDADDLVALAL